jgi:hypothetical protein
MARKKDSSKARAMMLGKRARHAYLKRQRKLEEGLEYEPYIHGEPPTPEVAPGGDRWDEAVAKVARQEKSMGKNWRMTSYPAQGELRRLLLPALVGQDGTWENPPPPTPANNPDPKAKQEAELRYKRTRLYERLAQVIQKDYEIHTHTRMGADEAMQFGLSWFKTYREEQTDLIGFQHVSCDRILYDSETEYDPLGKGQRWKAMCYTVSEEDAKLIAAEWGNKSYQFKAASNELSADESQYSGELSEVPTKFVKLIIFHVRGNSPHLANARMDSEPGAKVEEVGKDDVYTGSDYRILMEAEGDWTEDSRYSIIGEKEGPDYVTDHNDDCFTPIVLDNDPKEFWGIPVYQAGHSLQVSMNWSLRYYNTDLYNSARRVIGVLDGALDPAEEQKMLYDRGGLNIVHFRSRQDMEAGMKPITFGEPNPKLLEGVNINKLLFDQATGKVSFSGEGKSHETATRAALSSERSQLVLGGMSAGLERAVVCAMRKAIMANRQKLTAEQVAKWVGEEYLYFEPAGYDAKGNTLRKSLVWNDEVNDTESIRREVEIALRPRSIRFVSAEQKLNDMDRFQAKIAEWVSKVLEAQAINPRAAQEVARMGNVAIRAYGDLLNLNYAEEMQLDLKIWLQPTTDQMQAQQQMGVDAASAGAAAASAAQGAFPPSAPIRELGSVQEDLGLENAAPGQLGDAVAQARGAAY